MQELQVFKNNGFEIRVVGDSENPLFVAKDVCNALGLTNVSDSLSKLDDDEKGIEIIDTLGGSQKMSVITESGLYALIMRSNKKESKLFRKWVTGEVLPSIRKTGSYEKPMSMAEFAVYSAQKLLEVERLQIAQQKQLNEHESKLEALENRVEDTNGIVDYFTLVGYISYRKLPSVPLNEAAFIGRLLSQYCRKYKINIGTTPDARFGQVNTYPKEVIEEYFKDPQAFEMDARNV